MLIRVGTPSSSLAPEERPPGIVALSTMVRSLAITISPELPDQNDSSLASFSPRIAFGTTTENKGENPSLVIITFDSS